MLVKLNRSRAERDVRAEGGLGRHAPVAEGEAHEREGRVHGGSRSLPHPVQGAGPGVKRRDPAVLHAEARDLTGVTKGRGRGVQCSQAVWPLAPGPDLQWIQFAESCFEGPERRASARTCCWQVRYRGHTPVLQDSTVVVERGYDSWSKRNH